MTQTYLVTPEQTLAAARRAGATEQALARSGIAVLTFSRTVMDRLTELCALQDAAWISPLTHPYAAAEITKAGANRGLAVMALVPPMGASPLACVVEDLAACGVQIIYLVCAAWSLGAPVQLGDLIIPSFSLGRDGTSIHYGNSAGEIRTDPQMVEALAQACRSVGARYHVGGNGSCEALYRISTGMAGDFRARGCLTIENGEASTLLAVAQTLGIRAGILFQPYIELERGWDPDLLRDERYRIAGRLQAEAVIEASCLLLQAHQLASQP